MRRYKKIIAIMLIIALIPMITVSTGCSSRNGNMKEEKDEDIPVQLEGALYDEDGDLLYTWDEMLNEGIITVNHGILSEFAYDGESKYSLVIDSEVMKIGEKAFESSKSMLGVTIPDSVTKISEEAFSGCSQLRSIDIPNSVIEIGAGAFLRCSSLYSVSIPEKITMIAENTFLYCSSLTEVNIPNSVTVIGQEAFSGCSSLVNIDIPDSVTEIGDNAFCSCSELYQVNIPASVTVIGDRAFSSCENLSIMIPYSLTSIGENAFYNVAYIFYAKGPDLEYVNEEEFEEEFEYLPGYEDKSQWADEPIELTEVENIDVFDEMKGDNESYTHSDKEKIEDLILEYAQLCGFECYANPTVITEYIGYYSADDGFMVDYHTKEHDVISFSRLDLFAGRSRSVVLSKTIPMGISCSGDKITLVNPGMIFAISMMEEKMDPYKYNMLNLENEIGEGDDEWIDASYVALSAIQGFMNYWMEDFVDDIVAAQKGIPKEVISNLKYAYIDDWGNYTNHNAAYVHIIFTGEDAENYYTLSGYAYVGYTEFTEDCECHLFSQKEMNALSSDKKMSPSKFEYAVKKK